MNDPLDPLHAHSVLLVEAIREHTQHLHELVAEWKPRPYPGRRPRPQRKRPFIVHPKETHV